jgi:hypothetical protein
MGWPAWPGEYSIVRRERWTADHPWNGAIPSAARVQQGCVRKVIGGWVDFDGSSVQVGSIHGDPGRFTAGEGPSLAFGD